MSEKDDNKEIFSGEPCIWYAFCPMKRFVEQGLLDKKWIRKYCFGDQSQCVRKKLEDEGKYHPDNMLPDGSIDERLR
ncbi:MAG: uracil-DNA glycosylase [Spirochaetes bacterium]|nr:uracil-DNA glycosylase [Spirochaetota bacterium]